jgi:hypothetical protein
MIVSKFSFWVSLPLLATACLVAPGPAGLHAAELRVDVDLSKPLGTMRGGIGASLHAIEKPMLVTPGGDARFGGIISHGGSGWGAYPPAEDEKGWRQIQYHADWLGLDWCRVEFEQRMYEPERNHYDWDNPEMRILYRILDWCQRRGCDVFLTQMWSNVRWNAFPEYRDDEAGRIHSGPASLEDFVEGLTRLVEHLVKTRKYTCIRWLAVTNEPGDAFSWFQKPPNQPLSITPALAAVRRAFDRRGIDVQLSAPDRFWAPLAPAKEEYRDFVGAFDVHEYPAAFDWLPGGPTMAWHVERVKAYAQAAHQQHKPLFVAEMGTLGGWSAALTDAEKIVRDLPVGVDGFNRWSFLNRGDLDGEWQLLRTWDAAHKKLLDVYVPQPNAYYVLGLLSRFTAKHSTVLGCGVTGGTVGPHPRVFAAPLRSPKGNLTLAVLNDADQGWDATIELRGVAAQTRLYRYDVSRTDQDRSDLRIDSKAEFGISRTTPSFRDRLAPQSLTIYTTYRLAHCEPGIVAED